MLSKEEIEQTFEGMEYFIDDDYGGQYKSVVGNQDANSMLGYLKIRDYILNIQDRLTELETEKQNVIEKLEEKIEQVEKCYQDLINPYYDKKLNIINTSLMNKKEKEEFINKRNCLLVQEHCYKEILSLVKGENDE